MNTRILFLASIVPALTWPSAAAAQGEPKRPDAEGRPMAGSHVKHGMHLHRATDIVGTKVKNPQGEDLGKIEELVLDPKDGTVEYAVLSFGGFMGVGDKFFAIPFSLIGMPGAKDHSLDKPERGKEGKEGGGSMNDGEPGQDRKRSDSADAKDRRKPAYFVLNVDKERLKKASGFPKDNWPDIHTAEWRSEIDKYYGVPKRTREETDPGEAIDKNRQFKICKVGDLYGKNVYNAAGDKLGDVKNLVIDHDHARVQYAVVSTGGLLDSKQIAVPWGALKHQKDRDSDKDKVVLDVPKEKLARAPEYKDSEWGKMTDPAWCRELYSFYEQRPYWKDGPAEAGATRPRKE
jgi:sporulation protein YlmC with PRC-barrel domain